jgi:general stress protein YciG
MKRSDERIKQYLAAIGSKGGNARAEKYDKATLSKWAKKGGRPPKKGKKK